MVGLKLYGICALAPSAPPASATPPAPAVQIAPPAPFASASCTTHTTCATCPAPFHQLRQRGPAPLRQIRNAAPVRATCSSQQPIRPCALSGATCSPVATRAFCPLHSPCSPCAALVPAHMPPHCHACCSYCIRLGSATPTAPIARSSLHKNRYLL